MQRQALSYYKAQAFDDTASKIFLCPYMNAAEKRLTHARKNFVSPAFSMTSRNSNARTLLSV
jgi:hypothetical protein